MTLNPYLPADMDYLAFNGYPGKNIAETFALSISSMVVNVVLSHSVISHGVPR